MREEEKARACENETAREKFTIVSFVIKVSSVWALCVRTPLRLGRARACERVWFKLA